MSCVHAEQNSVPPLIENAVPIDVRLLKLVVPSDAVVRSEPGVRESSSTCEQGYCLPLDADTMPLTQFARGTVEVSAGATRRSSKRVDVSMR